MQKELLDQLETPCIVIDMARAEENVIRMQAEADAAGCRLRPHIKTHKMPLLPECRWLTGLPASPVQRSLRRRSWQMGERRTFLSLTP